MLMSFSNYITVWWVCHSFFAWDRQGAAVAGISLPEVISVGEKDGLLARAAQLFDLPADAVANVPRVEIVGDGELRMAPHRGILAYGPEEIHISGGKLVVLVRGSGLELRAMTPEELLITGTITCVEFMR